MIQQRLSKPKVKYSYGSYNKSNEVEQWIRITEGCPHNCPWCYEPTEIKIFGIPEIIRNEVIQRLKEHLTIKRTKRQIK